MTWQQFKHTFLIKFVPGSCGNQAAGILSISIIRARTGTFWAS